MATGDELQHKRKKDRLTASLALAAAHRRGPATPCLSPEELAELVDGTVSAAERQAANDHLADCEHCYDAWLTVSEALAHSRRSEHKDRKLISLFSPQNFRWWGAALAVAASVVVFINIRDSAIRETMDDLAPSPEVIQDKRTEYPAEISKSAESLILQPVAESVLGGVEKKEQANGLAEEVELPSVESWLLLVAESCRVGTSDPVYWEKTRQQGIEIARKGVPESDLADFAVAQRVRLTKVLELLQPVKSAEHVAEQCGRVLTFLAEEDESR